MDDDLRDRCAVWIGDLHRVIEDWLTGRSPRTGDALAAFDSAHADRFTMINPDGTLLRRDELLPGFESAHGSVPELSIRIENVAVLHASADVVLVTYEEWQGSRGRRSTVLLAVDGEGPGGMRSRHLHETWIVDG
jgi:hypothetical protein